MNEVCFLRLDRYAWNPLGSGSIVCAILTWYGLLLPAQENREASGLVQISSQQRIIDSCDAGSIHVVVRNSSDVPVGLSHLTVSGRKVIPIGSETRRRVKKEHFRLLRANEDPPKMPAEAYPGEPLWCWFSSDVVSPGGCAEVIVRFRTQQNPVPPMEIETDVGEFVSVSVSSQFPFRVVGSNFPRSLDCLYVYLRDEEKAMPWSISSVSLLSRSSGIDDRCSYAEWSIDDVRVLKLRVNGISWGDRIFVFLKLADGQCLAFSTIAVGGFMIENPDLAGVSYGGSSSHMRDADLLGSYVEYGYRYDVVGADIIDALRGWESSDHKVTGSTPSALFVQGSAGAAVTNYGELVPLSVICCDALQVSYQAPYDSGDMKFRQSKARFLRQAVAPNRLLLEFRAYQGYAGVERFMSPMEMRLAAYQLLSRGSKGFRVRRPRLEERRGSLEWDQCEHELSRLFREVNVVGPLLAIAEPVDGIASVSEPLVEVSTLLAGDRALIAMLVNHDCSCPWPKPWDRGEQEFLITPKADPITIKIRIPDGLAVAGVVEVGDGTASRTPFSRETDGSITITSRGLGAAKQYVLCFSLGVVAELLSSVPVQSIAAEIDALIDGVPPIPDGARAASRMNSSEGALEHAPDIQVVTKQVAFGSVDPVQDCWEKEVEVRNVGENELKVWSNGQQDGVSVFPARLRIPGRGKASLAVKLDLTKLTGSRLVRYPLHTNDPNESEVFLDVGYRVQAEVVLGASGVVLEAGKTVHVPLVDYTGWNLKVLDVQFDGHEVQWEASCTDRLGEPNYCKVRDLSAKTRLVDVSLTLPAPASGTVEGSSRKDGVLIITTNNALHHAIHLPVRLRPSLRASAVPPVLFAGMLPIGKSVTRQCTVFCSPEAELVSAVCSEKGVVVEALPRTNDGFAVRLPIRATALGKQEGKLIFGLRQGALRRVLEVPVTYIGVP